MMTIALILVLELSSKKKRGLFVGLVNAGFTTGVSFGAVLAGALLPVTGWVRFVAMCVEMQNAHNFPEILVLGSSSIGISRCNWTLLKHPKFIHIWKACRE